MSHRGSCRRGQRLCQREVLRGMQAACWGVLLAACGLPAAGLRAAPVDIATGTAGLQLWFDASQQSSLFTGTTGTGAITPNTAVAYWGDLSGQTGGSRNVTQGTSGSRPTWQTNVINGKAVVRFDGQAASPDFLTTGSIPVFNNNATALSWFVVSRPTGGITTAGVILRSAYNVGISGTSGTSAGRAELWGTSIGTTGILSMYSRTSAGTMVPSTGTTAFNTSSISTGIITPANSGSVFGFVNGVAGTTGTGANTLSGTHSMTRIGLTTHNNVSNPFKGDVAEVLVYTSSFNTAQRLVMENYLGAKYGINLADNQVTNGNYQLLSGTYRNDVIGIGRAADDTTSTAGSLAGLALIGTLTGTGSWVFAGNGDAYATATSLQTANTLVSTALPALATDRWSRVWNVTNVGTLASGDTIGLTFDWNAGGLGGSFSGSDNFALLYSSTANPDVFTTLLPSYSTLDADAKTVTFNLTGDTFDPGFYTIAIVPEPGGAAFAGGAAAAWFIGRGLRRRWQARG